MWCACIRDVTYKKNCCLHSVCGSRQRPHPCAGSRQNPHPCTPLLLYSNCLSVFIQPEECLIKNKLLTFNWSFEPDVGHRIITNFMLQRSDLVVSWHRGEPALKSVDSLFPMKEKKTNYVNSGLASVLSKRSTILGNEEESLTGTYIIITRWILTLKDTSRIIVF